MELTNKSMTPKQLRTLPAALFFGAPCLPWNDDVNGKDNGNTFFSIFMRAVWTLDRLTRLINSHTIKGLILITVSGFWTLRF